MFESHNLLLLVYFLHSCHENNSIFCLLISAIINCHSNSLGSGKTDKRWRQACNADPIAANDDIFGKSPCRSPFATYLLKVPFSGSQYPTINSNGANLKVNMFAFEISVNHYRGYGVTIMTPARRLQS